MSGPMLGQSPARIAANCNLDQKAIDTANALGAANAAIAASNLVAADNASIRVQQTIDELAITNAQASAVQALSDAADALALATTAEADAQTGIANAAAAQETADQALALAGGGGGGPPPASTASFLYAGDLGVVGDGVIDDTTAMNTALATAAAQFRILYCKSLIIKISGALTMAGPGILFDQVPHGNAGGPGLKVTGTGYTALTTTGIVTTMSLTLWGTGNVANAVLMQNPILSNTQNIRVFNLSGFGVKINKCYDCKFGPISIEQCGNASNYAFSVLPAGDTSNMSHFTRIQVEKATQKAIEIDGSTLSCVFDNIHSEQAVATAGVATWILGGSRCQYNAIRLAATVPANANAQLNSGNSTYLNLLSEGAIDISVDPGDSGSCATFVNPEVQGTFHITNGSLGGFAILQGGLIHSTIDPTIGPNDGTTMPGIRAFGTHFQILAIGFQTNFDAKLARFVACQIDNMFSTSTHSSATFVDCTINNCYNGSVYRLLQGNSIYINCYFTPGNSVNHSSGSLTFIGGVLNGVGIIFTNAAAIRASGGFVHRFVTNGDAGGVDVLFDSSVRQELGGGTGASTFPTAGSHVQGDRHFNPTSVVGQPKSWVCTVSGTPGTFVSEGNL